MRVNNIVLAAVLASSASGCTDEEQPPEVCDAECVGDTICADGMCQEAFPRRYEVQLTPYRIGVGFCADCEAPPMTVYFSGLEDPIMNEIDPRVVEIDVEKGSSLIVDFESEQCALELTAARLRSGRATCTSATAGAILWLTAMPLDPMSL